MRVGGQDGICFRDMTHTALQIDRVRVHPIKRIRVKGCTSIETDIGVFMLPKINRACVRDRRKGGSEPRWDPPPVLGSCTADLDGTWRLRRRFQGQTMMDAQQPIPAQEGILNRCSLQTDLDTELDIDR